jgi:hypothetical protein
MQSAGERSRCGNLYNNTGGDVTFARRALLTANTVVSTAVATDYLWRNRGRGVCLTVNTSDAMA